MRGDAAQAEVLTKTYPLVGVGGGGDSQPFEGAENPLQQSLPVVSTSSLSSAKGPTVVLLISITGPAAQRIAVVQDDIKLDVVRLRESSEVMHLIDPGPSQ